MTIWQVHKYLPQKDHLIHPPVLINPDRLADGKDMGWYSGFKLIWEWR